MGIIIRNFHGPERNPLKFCTQEITMTSLFAKIDNRE